MEEEKTLLVQCLGNSPKLRIIDFLIDNRPFDYSKKEIIEGSGMGKVTFYKVWEELIKFGIMQQTRKYGKAKLFKLNEDSEVVKKLLVLNYSLIKQTMDKAVKESETIPQKVRA